jgi:predicted alpha/beta-hydrolase family hydrolase
VTEPTVYRAAAPAGRLLVLAHGAGAGQLHPFMTGMSSLLAARGIDVVTFDFDYMRERRKVPDKAPVLEACFGRAIDWATARPEFSGHRLFIGGKSMGGRMATHLAAAGFAAHGGAGPSLAGVVALGYPLHPPGKPETLRVEHFKRLTMPVLFASGTRDAFGTPAELKRHAKKVKGPVTFHWVETGDHGFKPLKASGLTAADALRGVAGAVVAFVQSLT